MEKYERHLSQTEKYLKITGTLLKVYHCFSLAKLLQCFFINLNLFFLPLFVNICSKFSLKITKETNFVTSASGIFTKIKNK